MEDVLRDGGWEPANTKTENTDTHTHTHTHINDTVRKSNDSHSNIIRAATTRTLTRPLEKLLCYRAARTMNENHD